MPRAVRYDGYGPISVLRVEEVPEPLPGPGQVVVRVAAAGINPGEAAIRQGAMAEMFPSTFPSGQGSDLAGTVHAVGSDVTGWQVGDEVLGWSDERSAHADFVAVPSDHLTSKPPTLGWAEAGALHVAGCTAYAAVRAVDPAEGETVAVSGAAGGVGSIVVQLLRTRGVRVLAIAGEANAEWLRTLDVEPVAYGDGLVDRLRAAAPDGIDAFIDTYGGGYVEQAIGLGVAPHRVDTIIDFAAAKEFGVKTDGMATAESAGVLGELAELVTEGRLVVPIAASYPIEQVAEAYTELEQRHTRGKIVLTME